MIQHPFGCEPNCFGTLTVASFSLNTWGWMVQDLTSLWWAAEYVGENRVIPGQAGRVGYPRELDETPFSLVLYVTGGYEDDGTPYADPVVGLELNLELIRTNVTAEVTTGDGARACTLTMPSGATRTARVQFDALRRNAPMEDPMLVEFVLSGTIIDGRFD